jgi:hypothetical protein
MRQDTALVTQAESADDNSSKEQINKEHHLTN